MPEWAQSSQRPCKVDPKMPMKILSHYPPVPPSIKSCDTKSFPETFLSKIKASKCPAKEKKRLKKSKRKQEVKEKLKVETAVSLLNPKPQNFAICASSDLGSWNFASGKDKKATKC